MRVPLRIAARHRKPYLDRFPAKNFLVIQFDAIRRAPHDVRECVYEFLGVTSDFTPNLEAGKNAARAPRFPLLQSGAQRVYEGVSALPGVGKILKSLVVAKPLQIACHQLNSKAQKYEQLAQQERRKWEEYYAIDQEELSKLFVNLQVIE